MNYEAHAALLLAHGPVRASGFQWMRLARQLLREGVATLAKAEWLNYKRSWKGEPPDMDKESAYDLCVGLRVEGQPNLLLRLVLTLHDGGYDGEPTEERCLFVLSDVGLGARSLLSLKTGKESQTELDSLLQRNLRYLAHREIQRKREEKEERELQEEESALLRRYGHVSDSTGSKEPLTAERQKPGEEEKCRPTKP